MTFKINIMMKIFNVCCICCLLAACEKPWIIDTGEDEPSVVVPGDIKPVGEILWAENDTARFYMQGVELCDVVLTYENKNKSVLVLCPKKLNGKWQNYRANYKNNPIAGDRLRYDILFHTDLSRDHGESNGLDLANVNWGNYDLIVIDEISMVRADLLDAVDDVLRRLRRNSKPFGGVQLLLIGDPQQLAPVVREEEWTLLSPYYSTLYFFYISDHDELH